MEGSEEKQTNKNTWQLLVSIVKVRTPKDCMALDTSQNKEHIHSRDVPLKEKLQEQQLTSTSELCRLQHVLILLRMQDKAERRLHSLR